MMRRVLAFMILAAAMLAPIGAGAQVTPSFSPTGGTTLAVSNSSSRVAFATPGPTALITNTGSVTAYLNFGGSAVTATTGGYLLGAGCSIAYNVNGQPDVAAITAASTTTLTIITGAGLPTLPQSACTQTISGTVTVTGTVTANQGTAGAAAWPVLTYPTNASAGAIAHGQSTATESGHAALCSAACNLYSLTATNLSTSTALVLMVFNSTTVPGDGAVTPDQCLNLPASGVISISASGAPPTRYSAGISVAVSSGSSCTTKTASVNGFFTWGIQQ